MHSKQTCVSIYIDYKYESPKQKSLASVSEAHMYDKYSKQNQIIQ